MQIPLPPIEPPSQEPSVFGVILRTDFCCPVCGRGAPATTLLGKYIQEFLVTLPHPGGCPGDVILSPTKDLFHLQPLPVSEDKILRTTESCYGWTNSVTAWVWNLSGFILWCLAGKPTSGGRDYAGSIIRDKNYVKILLLNAAETISHSSLIKIVRKKCKPNFLRIKTRRLYTLLVEGLTSLLTSANYQGVDVLCGMGIPPSSYLLEIVFLKIQKWLRYGGMFAYPRGLRIWIVEGYFREKSTYNLLEYEQITEVDSAINSLFSVDPQKTTESPPSHYRTTVWNGGEIVPYGSGEVMEKMFTYLTGLTGPVTLHMVPKGNDVREREYWYRRKRTSCQDIGIILMEGTRQQIELLLSVAQARKYKLLLGRAYDNYTISGFGSYVLMATVPG